MVKIRMKLNDGQGLGYIQLRNNQPFYGYDKTEATFFELKEAQKLCRKFSNKYICIIEEPKANKPKENAHIQIKYI